MMMMDGPAKRVLAQLDMDKQENFSPEQIERFKSQPEFYRDFVKTVEKEISGAFPVVSLPARSLPGLFLKPRLTQGFTRI